MGSISWMAAKAGAAVLAGAALANEHLVSANACDSCVGSQGYRSCVYNALDQYDGCVTVYYGENTPRNSICSMDYSPQCAEAVEYARRLEYCLQFGPDPIAVAACMAMSS